MKLQQKKAGVYNAFIERERKLNSVQKPKPSDLEKAKKVKPDKFAKMFA